MRSTLLAVSALLSLFLATALVGQGSATDRMSPELLWKLNRVGDPQLSPDGKKLLYHVRNYDLAANRGVTQIWLHDLATGESKAFTSTGSNSSGRWSADGSEIAFVSNRSGSAQIHRISIHGGEAQQVTDHPGGVSNMAWSPDNAHFSFTAAVQLDEQLADRHPDLPQAEAMVYDDLLVRHWDSWKDGTYSHLFVVPATGGPARDLMGDERVDTPLKPFGGGEQIVWTPDSKRLLYVAKRVDAPESTTNSDIYTVAIDGGPHHNLTAGMPGYEINPQFSPDGREFSFESMARDGYESDRNRVFVRNLETDRLREVTAGWDLTCAEHVWSSDSRQIYIVADTQGTRQVFRVDAAGGARPREVTSGRWHFGHPIPAPDDATLYALRQHTERPYEIVRIDARKGGAGEPITDHNGAFYAGLQLPKVEERRFEATDGKSIHSWVIYPPGFDPAKKYPMLTYCQGGPQSQVGQWFSYRWNFHLMAAQGYIVLAVNRRGLPGFGTEWNEQISRDWGGQAMQDLLTATDAMQEQPFVDRERTAAIGASFGGYTVYWLMGHDQADRFCTMIAHCGVFNLRSMYLSTEELFFVNWDLGASFWDNPDVKRDYERFSPHEYIQNWDTPLLVIHGQRDYRVPLEQGLQAFTAAQERGLRSRFLYFPTESHWVLAPQNGVVWHREFFRWLDEFCKPEGAGKPRTGHAEQVDGRQHLLEQVDDTAIAQLYADGFSALPLRDKQLCYHLARAAIAGRDIFIDQKFEHSLAIRDVLERLWMVREVLAPETRRELERYTKLFWVHNGIHHAVSSRKILLNLTKAKFDAAILDAQRAGMEFAPKTELDEIYAICTDPATFQAVTQKSPGEGKDPLVVSDNNLYVGVSTAQAEAFDEKYPLNSRLVNVGGELIEEVYRAGDPDMGIPPGRYAKQITAVIQELERAIPFAPEATQKAVHALIRYYKTGSPEDWRAFNIAWVADTESVVDQINGFIEVYMDVRGQKGAWEAVVSFLDQNKTRAIKDLAAKAQWFEDRMPWDAEFKKENVRGIAARAIAVLTETGDSGPVTPIGINLPNETEIRENFGSKSVSLANVIEGYDRISTGGSLAEFSWDAAEVERAKKWAGVSGEIHTNLHEVVGHASGKLRPEIVNPASRLGLYYSTLEEARADLVGLYWIADPALLEMGLVPHPDCAIAEYEAYARNALVQLRRVEIGHRLEEDHMRNRQMIVLWLIDNAQGAIDVRKRDGRTYYVVPSVKAFRAGCAKLLAEVMRIKATGDFKAGKALVDTYGSKIDPSLHAEVLARIENLGLPSVTGFVQPELSLLRDDAGAVVDVLIHYPKDLAAQMLRWSGAAARHGR